MALRTLEMLSGFSDDGFLPGTPDNMRTFFAPVDDVHGVLKMMLESASQSLIVAMYAFTDEELAEIILQKLKTEECFVQVTLDWSQASMSKEKELLKITNFPASSIAIGKSEKGSMMHMKMVIIDGLDVITGSTNWSDNGQTQQDNQLTVIRDYSLAAHSRARIDAIHANIVNREKK
jgi:phosphatidylserine/phosphatidylglycerophosphate/cardiolipin synthase-like enzyme